MPRARHDTSSDDSDSSEDERGREKTSRRSHNSARSGNSTESPDKYPTSSQKTRKRADSEQASSPENVKSRDHKQFSSDSDSSPIKGSVVSKVERANVASASRDRESEGRGQRYYRDERIDVRGDNTGQRFNRREGSPRGFERGGFRNRGFPNRQRPDDRLPRRQDRQNRSVSRERNDRNFGRRRSLSPDRNPRRFDTGRNDNFGRGRGQGPGWREPMRDRFGNDNRGQNFRNDPRSRSFDRQNNSGRSRDFDNDRNRQQNRGRSRSPVQDAGRSRNNSQRSVDEHDVSPEPVRSRSHEGQRSLSPVLPSKSDKSKRKNKSVSVERKKASAVADIPTKTKRSVEREATPKDVLLETGNIMFDDDGEGLSDISKKSKSKKKKKEKTDKEDSVERSFERSKLLLGENTHSDDLIPEEMTSTPSPAKGQKKSKSKRQRELSGTEESPTKQSKKSKLGKSLTKKAKKLSKKKQSMTHSPSPVDNLASAGRSSSSERPYEESHDLRQFESESEPESGEITDSEEDREKQHIKSLVNKPVVEEEPALPAVEDERYLNQKRKEAKMKERQADKEVRDKGSKRKAEEPKEAEVPAETAPKKPKPAAEGVEAFTGRTGGAYIPPARLRAMQASITDKSSVEYQRISWEALKKSINGLVNKVNVANIENIVREIFQENIVRGRGLMARSIIQAQAASPTFTHVYAALVAIVNTKFPQNGELILKRLILQFRRGYKRNDKSICLSATRFIAHLVNQQVAHEVLALEILTLLLETPSDDSVEVAIGFLKECGQKLTEVSPRGINAIFERLRNVLHEGQIDTRVQYMMEVMFAVRKDQFKDFPAILEDLDLVEEEDQFTHLMSLEDAVNGEEILNVFKPDPNFEENEEKYKILKQEILGEGGSDDEDEGSGSGSGSDSDEEDSEDEEAQQKIIDQTETNMVALRRTIYLTIQSSLDFEECAHKLMKMELKPGQEVELCSMILDCCAQMRTYEKFFGLLAGRFCMLDKKYVEPFQRMFKEQYDTIHRLETNKLRNVAKFFAHLLHTDSISWAVMQAIKLNEDDTTSASRIFIKILFQELSEYMGLPKLNGRLKDPTLQEYYAGLLPRDNPRDTRFAINFFTTIGLGGLTDDLRDHLKDVSKQLMQQKQEEQAQAMQAEVSDESSSSSEESDSSEESSSSDSSSDSESSEDERRKKKAKKTKASKEKEKKTASKQKKVQDTSLERDGKKGRDKTNGSLDKNGRNAAEKVSKKDKKKSRNADKEFKMSEEEKRKEQEEQFKRLAKLADYGNIDDLSRKADDRAQRSESKTKSKKDKKDKKSKEKKDKRADRDLANDDYGDLSGRDLEPEVLDEFDARRYAADSSFEGRDSRGGARDDRRRREDRGPLRDERGDFEVRRGRKDGGGRRDKGRGKKGRDFSENEMDDSDIRIERNFERLDLYEEKFQRQREQDLQVVRGREEFQDYYRDREIDAASRRGGPYRGRGRGSPHKGGRGDRFGYEGRDLDRGLEEGPRRRNRSEERVVAGRPDRRRRR